MKLDKDAIEEFKVALKLKYISDKNQSKFDLSLKKLLDSLSETISNFSQADQF